MLTINREERKEEERKTPSVHDLDGRQVQKERRQGQEKMSQLCHALAYSSLAENTEIDSILTRAKVTNPDC